MATATLLDQSRLVTNPYPGHWYAQFTEDGPDSITGTGSTREESLQDLLWAIREQLAPDTHDYKKFEGCCNSCGEFGSVAGDYPSVCTKCFTDERMRDETTIDVVRLYFPEVTEDNFHEYLEKFIELSKEG